jgi:hydroxymethylbilane synthase
VAENVNTLRLGTRGSALALAQTNLVKVALEQLSDCPRLEIQTIKTSGDQHLELSLKESGQSYAKGLFTKELEVALLDGNIDLAVHSLKDLPTDLAPEFDLAAVLPRHDPVDVLISKQPATLNDLAPGAVIATSSPRRTAQLRFLRGDLRIVEVRGNVQTRLSKLQLNPGWSALVLAKAGLERLGFKLDGATRHADDQNLFFTELRELYPAIGQGVIAIEILRARDSLRAWLQQINDRTTWACTSAEREFLRLVQGGCHTPIGMRSSLHGLVFSLQAMIFEETGAVRHGSVSGTFAEPRFAAEALFENCYGPTR